MVRTVSRGNPHTARRAPGAPTRLRRSTLLTPHLLAPLVLTVLLAGCGAGPAPITVGAGEPADGMVAGPVVTAGPPGGTDSIALSNADSTGTAGATGPTGATGPGSPTSPGPTSAGTGLPTPPDCASIALDAAAPAGNTGSAGNTSSAEDTGAHLASNLRAYGLSCEAAGPLVRTISAGQLLSAGSTTFTRAGFRCVTRVSLGAAPSADYDCSRPDGGRVRWHRT